MNRENKHHILLRAKEGYNGFPPSSLIDFAQWADDQLRSIPVELRGTARIEFEVEYGYNDSSWVELTISYIRPETDEEMREREAEQAAREEKQRENELAVLRRLQAKYGGVA